MDFSLLILLVIFNYIVAENDFSCPTSGSAVHAGCKVYIVFENPCSTVQQEMMKRINGQMDGSWYDPHNNGTYSVIDSPAGLPALWQLQRVTGDLKYTDLINYNFYSYGETSCQVYACSESQVFSIGDSGTNYCNIHDLYCDEPGCKPFYKLFYDEEIKKCTQATIDTCTA